MFLFCYNIKKKLEVYNLLGTLSIERNLIKEKGITYKDRIIEASPFVKWAGGKSKLIQIILNKVSNHFHLEEMEHYIEPFVGGGAMFFYLANHYRFKSMTIMDINLDLINTYRSIKSNPLLLIRQLDVLQQTYNNLPTLKEKELFYYEIRNEYNDFPNEELLNEQIDYQRAAQFVFLNKSGFNGLYRVNKSGSFNVPFGKKKKINIYDEKNIKNVSEVLQRTKIVHGDYSETINFVQSNTFVYFDPPYRPIKTTSSFTAYDRNGFNDDEQINLAQLCLKLYILGVRFALSNSDPHNTNPTDMFFDDLYKNFYIYRINAPRQIAAEASSRRQLSEILVIG